MPWIDEGQPLPPGSAALGPDSEVPGLVAAGGKLGVDRLEEAYRKGIFPWYSRGQPVLWWSPDPRMVLRTGALHLPHGLKKALRRFRRGAGCELRFDADFDAVIGACAQTPRAGQDGTWIVPEVVRAYGAWHRAGFVHSVETRIDGALVGGLYFVSIGRMCYGESMFSRRSDASKIAFAALVAACRARGVEMIDCQQHTGHLATFGAREIPRAAFEAHLAATVDAPAPAAWTYDDSHWDLLPEAFSAADPAADRAMSSP